MKTAYLKAMVGQLQEGEKVGEAKKWTAEVVQSFYESGEALEGSGFANVAAAINAALAVERQATSNAFSKGYDQGRADATTAEWHKGWVAAVEANEGNKARLITEITEQARKPLEEALRQIATIEANDPEEVSAGLPQTQSYEIATAALAKEGGK